MPPRHKVKISSVVELMQLLPDDQRLLTDILRQFVLSTLPKDCKEKISYNVPFFYRKRGICIIWPAAIPGGGISKGVLFGFWYGNKLNDGENYLDRGTNKQIFYKLYSKPEEINFEALSRLLKEAYAYDEIAVKRKFRTLY
ncbi:MAG TPA: DUF1801 domain-containing protein [Bacteroidia bacterium]|nr:DUF1801 domain-containing protein [Bacteroidia bacterium]HRH07941.1 DUF1801 domain-containing protein [Bacteroidia bacterium]HRH62505.1 DUF1801 domain-containing protein [Bacteroidia bacterium]